MAHPVKGEIWPVVLVDPATGLPLAITVTVAGEPQIPTVEQNTPLGPGASKQGAAHNVTNYESFGIAVNLKPGVANPLDATVLVENSDDGLVWEPVQSFPLAAAAGVQVNCNKVWAVTRPWYRATVTNNDMGNALDKTLFSTILKPV